MMSFICVAITRILCLVQCLSTTQLDHIPVLSWYDLVVNDTISEYLESRPFVVRDSPIRSTWRLFHYLHHLTIDQGNTRLISYFDTPPTADENDRRFSFLKAEFRETDCCFTDSPSVCKEYVSSFLYTAFVNRLQFWSKYERNHRKIQHYESCTNSTIIESASMKEVIDRIQSIDDNNHNDDDDDVDGNGNDHYQRSVYMNGNIPMSMFRDMNGLQPFLNVFHFDAKYGEFEVYLWMGSRDGFANRHYDLSNNLFFILRGSKLFRLSPPSLSQFTIYPNVHGAWRQEILYNFDDGNSGNPQNDEKEEEEKEEPLIMDVVLESGEILYIPPMWYHLVKNLDSNTIGTNLWWYSPIHEKMDALWSGSLPIEDEWSRLLKYEEMMYFVHRLLHRMEGFTHFVAQNYMEIYPVLKEMKRVLMESNVFAVDPQWEWMTLFVDIESIEKCLFEESDVVSISELLTASFECSATSRVSEKWNVAMDSMEKVLLDLNGDGMRDVLLSDLIEKLMAFFVHGDDSDVSSLPLLIAISGI